MARHYLSPMGIFCIVFLSQAAGPNADESCGALLGAAIPQQNLFPRRNFDPERGQVGGRGNASIVHEAVHELSKQLRKELSRKKLIPPQPGRNRNTGEIEAWMTYLRQRMSDGNFTVEEFFAILDVGFSSTKFSFAEALADANVSSVKFIGKQNRVLRMLFGRRFKAGAKVGNEEKTGNPETQLKIYGDIPQDPEDVAIWISEISMALYSASSKVNDQRYVAQAYHESMRAARAAYAADPASLGKPHPPSGSEKSVGYFRGILALNHELEAYLQTKYGREMALWKARDQLPFVEELPFFVSEKPSPRKLPIQERHFAYQGSIGEWYYRMKAYAKGVLTFKPLGVNTDIVGAIIEPLNVRGPSEIPVTMSQVRDGVSPEEVRLIRIRSERRMGDYLAMKFLGRWGSRLWTFMALGSVGVALYSTVYQATDVFGALKRDRAETRQVATGLNHRIDGGPALDYEAKMKVYIKLQTRRNELIELNMRERDPKVFQERDRVIASLSEQIEELSGKRAGVFKDEE